MSKELEPTKIVVIVDGVEKTIDAVQRECLKCGNKFPSPDKFTRVCHRCKSHWRDHSNGIAVHTFVDRR